MQEVEKEVTTLKSNLKKSKKQEDKFKMSSDKLDKILVVQRSIKNGLGFEIGEISQCKIERKEGPPLVEEEKLGNSGKDDKGKSQVEQQVKEILLLMVVILIAIN